MTVFDVASVATQLRGMVEGVVPTRFRQDDKEYDIRVRLAPEFRNDFQTIGRNGVHRYNNQDHAMLTGMLAGRNATLGERNDLVDALHAFLDAGNDSTLLFEIGKRDMNRSQLSLSYVSQSYAAMCLLNHLI